MSAALVLLVGLGGATGAVCRAALIDALDKGRAGWFPRGTFCVNCLACFLAGVFLALGLGAHPAALLLTGFCGGFSTLSSVNLDAAKLLVNSGEGAKSAAYLLATYAAAVVLAAIGFFLTSTLL